MLKQKGKVWDKRRLTWNHCFLPERSREAPSSVLSHPLPISAWLLSLLRLWTFTTPFDPGFCPGENKLCQPRFRQWGGILWLITLLLLPSRTSLLFLMKNLYSCFVSCLSPCPFPLVLLFAASQRGNDDTVIDIRFIKCSVIFLFFFFFFSLFHKMHCRPQIQNSWSPWRPLYRSW